MDITDIEVKLGILDLGRDGEVSTRISVLALACAAVCNDYVDDT